MDRLLRGCHPAVSFSYFALVIACAMFFMHPLCLALSLLGAGCCAAQLVGGRGLRFARCGLCAACGSGSPGCCPWRCWRRW